MGLKDGMWTSLATAVLNLFIEYLIQVGVLPLCGLRFSSRRIGIRTVSYFGHFTDKRAFKVLWQDCGRQLMLIRVITRYPHHALISDKLGRLIRFLVRVSTNVPNLISI